MPCKCCIKCNKVNCVQNEEINKQTKWTTKKTDTHTITNEAEDEANPYSYIYWTRNKCHTKSELPRRSTVRWKEKGHRKYHAHDENRIFYLSQWFIFYDPHHHKSKQFIFTGHKAVSKSALDIFQFLCHFFCHSVQLHRLFEFSINKRMTEMNHSKNRTLWEERCRSQWHISTAVDKCSLTKNPVNLFWSGRVFHSLPHQICEHPIISFVSFVDLNFSNDTLRMSKLWFMNIPLG